MDWYSIGVLVYGLPLRCGGCLSYVPSKDHIERGVCWTHAQARGLWQPACDKYVDKEQLCPWLAPVLKIATE